ncbi:MAG TPA: 16S rRNA (uracil(1498)-N(3))-methyltransferase [Burkholderiaceae bacterium]|nr:16S rRNA (uracil(1498)-N(3))-methyltransferase [Burkholderiaceae bacterium]
MPARLHVAAPALVAGAEFDLPEGAVRHVQVLRLQPGATLTLFDGRGAEWSAEVVQMGRGRVVVQVAECREVDRELPLEVTLALGVPANERMDTLVEKATELGVAAIQPLLCERSVLRLAGERALKRREHWQAIAIAACEQCGRNRVPRIEPIAALPNWLATLPAPPIAPTDPTARWLLSLDDDASPLQERLRARPAAVITLSGPEGGLSDAEEAAARRHGFGPTSLGPRVLRADTAPLALLAYLGLAGG